MNDLKAFILRIWLIRLFFVLIGFHFMLSTNGQNADVMTAYGVRSPVDHKIVLAGSFCEIRNTHFHTGIDIKPASTKKRNPIYSIADGYISRIKVQDDGYGLSVYIVHKKLGITSVYGHLDAFSMHLYKIVFAEQIKSMSYTVDIYLKPNQLPVKSGERVGYMGNTGNSYGTHLHFEIRDTKTEKPINPFLWGIAPQDHSLPQVDEIMIVEMDTDYAILQRHLIPIPNNGMRSFKYQYPILVSSPYVGIAYNGYDTMDGANNKNGIYKMDLWYGDSLLYTSSWDAISFAENRHIKGTIDYVYLGQHKKVFVQAFNLPNNVIQSLQDFDGRLTCDIFNSYDIRLEISDFHGNKKSIEFNIKCAPTYNVPWPTLDTSIFLVYNKNTEIRHLGCTINAEEGSLYKSEKIYLSDKGFSEGQRIYTISPSDIALKKAWRIQIEPDDPISEPLRSKCAVLSVNDEGDVLYNHGGEWEGDYFVGNISRCGQYRLGVDTVPPTIERLKFATRAQKMAYFSFLIKDNLKTTDRAKGISYQCFIDGKFYPASFKRLTHTLTIPLHDFAKGRHDIKIIAWDDRQNKTEFSHYFTK